MFNVLFVCSGNSARSIIAEAILNQKSKGKFKAYSAGVNPIGQVNPDTLEILSSAGISTEGLCSKGLDEFKQEGAPEIDFVVTVTEQVRDVECPSCKGNALHAHWEIEDPTASDKKSAYREVLRILENRIRLLVELPVEKLDELKMFEEMKRIGKKEEG